MPTLVTRILLYGCSSIPSLFFYILTEKYHGTPNSILLLIAMTQVLLPISFDGAGILADNAVLAVLSVTLGAGMVFYIRDIWKCGGDLEKKRTLPPFYFVLARWNENAPPSRFISTTTTRTHDAPDDIRKPPSVSVIRQDSRWWFLQSIGYMLLSVPVMSFFDGLLRVCQLPPDTETTSYWHRLPPPWQTLAYHLMAGFTLHLHVGIVEIIYRLFLTLRLATFSAIWSSSSTTSTKLKTLLHCYDATHRFISQPAIFDKPWLAHSAYNLWSERWHQIFRPGFMKLAYQPVRALFATSSSTNNKNQITMALMGRMTATMAVYVASGLLHDYILVIMMGYSTIQSYPGMLGQQTMFFILQGIASIVSAPGTPWSHWWARMPNWMARLLTLVWIIYTAPIFVDPYLRIGLHKEAEVPLYPRSFDPYIGFLCPYGSISL